MNKKDLTKELLANCFKDLLLTRPFEKITIKTITDRAGLIRPTFYKHFQDKYEVLEWIFMAEIAEEVSEKIERGDVYEGILQLLTGLEANRDFYRRALKITGPNSFLEVLSEYIYREFLLIVTNVNPKLRETYPALTKDRIAYYYSSGLVATITKWLETDETTTAKELWDGYCYFTEHSAKDLVNGKI